MSIFRYRILLSHPLLLLVGCALDSERTSTSDSSGISRQMSAEPLPPGREEHPEFDSLFAAEKLTGSFMLFDSARNVEVYYNEERCRERFMPASTFKIFNALVALETGVIRDEHHRLAWDSVERTFPGWNRDHDLKSGMRNSVVWYYQELARRIGEKRMQRFIDSVGYGNRSIEGGIDKFWLSGKLRISQAEQIDFLQRLRNDRLPFSKRSMKIVRDIIVLEDTLGYRLSGKTGWSDQDGKQIGWLVGYVERTGNVAYFALNIESPMPFDATFAAARGRLTREILRRLGFLTP